MWVSSRIFRGLADALTFSNLAQVEVQRRNVAQAREVSAVMDGADWLQFFLDKHRPDAVRILDFPHAAEHITTLLEALTQTGMRFPPHMLDRCLHLLKHRGPRCLLGMADRLGSDLAQQKGVQEHLDYLHKREALMRYPEFQRQGWPIGSGMVESANKNVVEARLKGTAMPWDRNHVNPMLALGNAVCNDRWREMWQKALKHSHQQRALQRSARTEQQRRSLLMVCTPSLPDSSPSPLPSAASQGFSLPVCPPALVPPARPSSSRPCPERKRQTVGNRMQSSPQKSAKRCAKVCLCGTLLVHLKGHRTKGYCSNRCRQRAYRERQRWR
jgi:hypothetical protein